MVYGDTDSVFVSLPGKTREQAFQIGNDIADTITSCNPAPIKLKFEKVYLPCVLLAKKRYVGFKYEDVDAKEPVFDAKGIETVRRDGVRAQQKMVEVCLKKLFRTQDLSDIKDYCRRTWMNLLHNKVSIQDFIFAKEVRMGTYSQKGPPPPGVAVAAKRMLLDPNDEPLYAERVPYVIVKGLPGTRLVERAIDPMTILNDSSFELDTNYYISRVLIPPLDRVLRLVGVDVKSWWNDMPKHQSWSDDALLPRTKVLGGYQVTNTDKEAAQHKLQCYVCESRGSASRCDDCHSATQEITTKLAAKWHSNEMRLVDAQRVCATCTGIGPGRPIACESIDCPWLYARKKGENSQHAFEAIKGTLMDFDDGLVTPNESGTNRIGPGKMKFTEHHDDNDDKICVSKSSQRSDRLVSPWWGRNVTRSGSMP